MWRIAPDAVRPALDQALSTAVIQQLEIKSPAQPLELTRRSRASLRLEAIQPATEAAGTVDLSRTAFGASRFAATRRTGEFAAVRGHAAELGALRAAASEPIQPAPPPPQPAAVSKFGSLLAVNASLHLADAIATDAQQHDVVTEQFGISVDICLVNLQRPWLSDAFLNVRGWFIPGFEKGEFSNGNDQEDGPFAILPTACILIRNLQITATWSEADRAVVEQAANLGTFSLFGRSFDSNTATLAVPGMQSIAWVCEPMPLLPAGEQPVGVNGKLQTPGIRELKMGDVADVIAALRSLGQVTLHSENIDVFPDGTAASDLTGWQDAAVTEQFEAVKSLLGFEW